MTVLDYILDGLEAELALERELGVRAVELESDKAALLGQPRQKPSVPARAAAPAKPSAPAKPAAPVAPIAPAKQDTPVPRQVQAISAAPAQSAPPAANGQRLDFVFLHDRQLSPNGAEMVAKIVKALGKTPETAPVLLERPFPAAKVYIVLGGLAMRKFFPELKGAPGKWVRYKTGEEVLVTYSPEYILRFGEVTPAVQKMKEDMWRSLKTAMQRTRLYA